MITREGFRAKGCALGFRSGIKSVICPKRSTKVMRAFMTGRNDLAMLSGDWKSVGDDMRTAIERLKNDEPYLRK